MNRKIFYFVLFLIFLIFAFSIFLINSDLFRFPKHEVKPFIKTYTIRPTVGSIVREVTMQSLVYFGKENQFKNGIPKIIHYNYKGKMVPSQYIPLVEKCVSLNPTVKFVIWSDSAAYNLIKNHFPIQFDIYKTYLVKGADPLKKSDIIRYFILYYFGGIYMDLDTRCQKPLEEAMKEDSCILSREASVQTRIRWNTKYYAMNSFMACWSNHSFFGFVIKNLRKDDNTGILWITGPAFLTALFDKYNVTLNKTDRIDSHKNVIVSSSDTFSPFTETFLESFCGNPSGEWQLKGCKDLPAYRKVEKEKISKAVVVHLFYHLGYHFLKHLIKTFEDISLIKGMYMVL